MKISISILTLVFVGMGLFGQESDNQLNKVNDKEKMTINHKMIERFNNCEYEEDVLNMPDLMQSYSFEEVKSIVHGYRSSDLCLNKTDIDVYLSEEGWNRELSQQLSEEKPVKLL